MTSNLPPRRLIQDQDAYEVVCISEPSVRFHVVAETETAAKILALDKVGYTVVFEDGKFSLVDADEPAIVVAALEKPTLVQALDAAMTLAGFSIKEPTQLLGGALGDGFGDVDE